MTSIIIIKIIIINFLLTFKSENVSVFLIYLHLQVLMRHFYLSWKMCPASPTRNYKKREGYYNRKREGGVELEEERGGITLGRERVLD